MKIEIPSSRVENLEPLGKVSIEIPQVQSWEGRGGFIKWGLSDDAGAVLV